MIELSDAAIERAVRAITDELVTLKARHARALVVVDAARAMVAFRNDAYGNPSKPEWWHGGDWRLVAAIHDYDQHQPTITKGS